MKLFKDYIGRSLSKRISSGILAFALAVFVVTIGLLFLKSRHMVLQEAFRHAECALDNTAQRLEGYLGEVETATHNMEWVVKNNMVPDSLFAFSRRIVELNPNINSCSITTEPDFFPEYGRYFSVYSVRDGDSIETVREGEYEYFDKVWYKAPHEARKAVWVDPFNDYNEGTLSSPEMIASYCVPLYDADSTLIGVLSTDISLPRLSKIISATKPYPNAYSMMLGREGHYFVHPDTSRLVTTTIFTDVDPKRQPDLIALGHEMVAGNKGSMRTVAEGVTYVSFYQPVKKTGWSLALVCVEADVTAGYVHLRFIVIFFVVIGLLVLTFYCNRTVRRFIAPVKELARQASHIADGDFSERMPRSNRTDALGNLQNNFATMQQTLEEHIASLRSADAEKERQNEELAQATRKADEADRKKMAFVQSVSHQLRTPLNIIMGFMQVLRDNFKSMTLEERQHLTATMQKNSTSVSRMVNMLLAASFNEHHQYLERKDKINCNAFAAETVHFFNSRLPQHITITVDSALADTQTITTNTDYLKKALYELLYNAKKFTVEGSITLRLRQGAKVVRFIVEDTGPGIPVEAQAKLFTQFEKLNDFTEGLGLGLCISRQFARMLGGDLFYDKDYKDGSRFVLEMPRVEPRVNTTGTGEGAK